MLFFNSVSVAGRLTPRTCAVLSSIGGAGTTNECGDRIAIIEYALVNDLSVIANGIAIVFRTECSDDSVLHGVKQLIKGFERSLLPL